MSFVRAENGKKFSLGFLSTTGRGGKEDARPFGLRAFEEDAHKADSRGMEGPCRRDAERTEDGLAMLGGTEIEQKQRSRMIDKEREKKDIFFIPHGKDLGWKKDELIRAA